MDIKQQQNESAQLKKTGNNSIRSQAEELEVAGMKFAKPIYDRSAQKHLDIPPELLHNELVYRWVVEEKIPSKERLGYQIVPKAHFKDGNIKTRRYVGRQADGKEQFQVLMATPRAYYEERAAAKDTENQKQIDDIRQGAGMGFEAGKEYIKEFNIK